MPTILDADIYAGISNVAFDFDAQDLGEGVLLSRTYARLMTSHMMSFTRPSEGSKFGEPWRAASGGRDFVVDAQLFLPASIGKNDLGNSLELLELIVSLLRLGENPSLTVPVISNVPFENVIDSDENELRLIPYETHPRGVEIATRAGTRLSIETVEWVRDNWVRCAQLVRDHREFSLAVQALDQAHFVRGAPLALVSIWAALESLFSPSHAELRFRVSSMIASYLESPGKSRLVLQKKIAKLYDGRSKVVHGGGPVDDMILLDSMILLRQILVKIVSEGEVPTPEFLEGLLFLAKA